MKISIILSLLILAIGGLLSGWNHRRLAAVRAIQDSLVAQAAASGILFDPVHPDGGRVTKRDREDKETVARQTAAAFMVSARETKARLENGGDFTDELQQHHLELMDRLLSLNASQLEIAIEEFRNAPDLEDEARHSLIAYGITTLAEAHPQAALTLISESTDLPNDYHKLLLLSSLEELAKADAQAALEWVRVHAANHPELATDDAKAKILSGAAVHHPKLAFSLLTELGIEDISDSVGVITRAAGTPARRTDAFVALQDYLATVTDPEARKEFERIGIRELTRNAVRDGFESCSQWLAEAEFSQEQLASLSNGPITYSIKPEDSGKWAEWMGNHLPEKNADDGIRNLVRRWTHNDYQAVGDWLASTPDSFAKETSTRAYAETLAGYEPESAVQWALTLPPGKPREQTLKSIYRRWPKKDDASKAAAAAFAESHGIER